jgi:hypothetical protein
MAERRRVHCEPDSLYQGAEYFMPTPGRDLGRHSWPTIIRNAARAASDFSSQLARCASRIKVPIRRNSALCSGFGEAIEECADLHIGIGKVTACRGIRFIPRRRRLSPWRVRPEIVHQAKSG